jgi:hypothetical protein
MAALVIIWIVKSKTKRGANSLLKSFKRRAKIAEIRMYACNQNIEVSM